MVDKWYV